MTAIYGPYTYKLTYCDEFTDYKSVAAKGILFANSYVEAVNHLIDYYGDNNIISIDSLIGYEENNLLEIKEDSTFNAILKELCETQFR